MSPIVLIGAGAAILVTGLGLGYLFGHIIRGRESAKASDVQAELDRYRQDVTEHFGETAAHFQTLGQQYRKLYEHMALGADALCDSNGAGRELSFAPSALLAPVAEQTESEASAEPSESDADAAIQPELEFEPANDADPDAAEKPVKAEEEVVIDAVADAAETEAAEELLVEKESSQKRPDAERIYH